MSILDPPIHFLSFQILSTSCVGLQYHLTGLSLSSGLGVGFILPMPTVLSMLACQLYLHVRKRAFWVPGHLASVRP